MLTRSIPSRVKPDALVGQLFDDNTCCVGDVMAAGRTPVLKACRELLVRGFNPNAVVEIYRRGALALRIRTLAAGARLAVEECSDGRPRFRPFRARPPSEGSSRIAQSAGPVGAVSSRMNWRRISERDRMLRRGVESIDGGTVFHPPRFENPSPKYRGPPTKAELRKQAAVAFLQWRTRQFAGQP